MGGKDGLVHVSEMKNERVEKPTDVVSEGQEVKVKVLEIDNRGKVRLSMRVVDQETGEELEDTRPAREPREPRGDRAVIAAVTVVARVAAAIAADAAVAARPRTACPRGDRDGGGSNGEGKEGGNPDHMPAFLKDD